MTRSRYVELASRAVAAGATPGGADVRFGAYACGHYGEMAGRFKREGYAAVFADPVCSSVQETARNVRGFRTLEASISVGFQPIWLLGPLIISARVLEI